MEPGNHEALSANTGPPLQCKLPAKRITQHAEIFKAIGSPIRLEILATIANHNAKVCACDFEELVDLSQPTVSHHLKKLSEAGLIKQEKQGTWTHYSIRPQVIVSLMEDLRDLLK